MLAIIKWSIWNGVWLLHALSTTKCLFFRESFFLKIDWFVSKETCHVLLLWEVKPKITLLTTVCKKEFKSWLCVLQLFKKFKSSLLRCRKFESPFLMSFMSSECIRYPVSGLYLFTQLVTKLMEQALIVDNVDVSLGGALHASVRRPNSGNKGRVEVRAGMKISFIRANYRGINSLITDSKENTKRPFAAGQRSKENALGQDWHHSK